MYSIMDNHWFCIAISLHLALTFSYKSTKLQKEMSKAANQDVQSPINMVVYRPLY